MKNSSTNLPCFRNMVFFVCKKETQQSELFTTHHLATNWTYKYTEGTTLVRYSLLQTVIASNGGNI